MGMSQTNHELMISWLANASCQRDKKRISGVIEETAHWAGLLKLSCHFAVEYIGQHGDGQAQRTKQQIVASINR